MPDSACMDSACMDSAYVFGVYAFGVYAFCVYAFGVYAFGVYTFGVYAFGGYTFGMDTFGVYMEPNMSPPVLSVNSGKMRNKEPCCVEAALGFISSGSIHFLLSEDGAASCDTDGSLDCSAGCWRRGDPAICFVALGFLLDPLSDFFEDILMVLVTIVYVLVLIE